VPEGDGYDASKQDELSKKGEYSSKNKLQPHRKAESKGYKGVKITGNGGLTFANTEYLYPTENGQSNIVNIHLTGSRRADFQLANEKAGLSHAIPKGKEAPAGYVWHHVDDYNPETGTATLELVISGAHRATYPHKGSVSQYEKYTGKKYKR